jgi:hypothetical protein
MIEISDGLARTLTYEDKLDRAPDTINRLILEREKQGHKCVEARLTLLGRGGNGG